MEVIQTFVAGVSFANADGSSRRRLIATFCRLGIQLKLQREAFNMHDRNAVAVYCGAGQIGYLPRDVAVDVSAQMDGGATVTASLTSISENQGYLEVGIRVELQGLKENSRKEQSNAGTEYCHFCETRYRVDQWPPERCNWACQE